jgi:hypothetical protein
MHHLILDRVIHQTKHLMKKSNIPKVQPTWKEAPQGPAPLGHEILVIMESHTVGFTKTKGMSRQLTKWKQ